MLSDPIVIVGMARTPMGSFQGDLKDATGPELGATAMTAALLKAGVKPEDVQEVIMGCVLPHGQRQGPDQCTAQSSHQKITAAAWLAIGALEPAEHVPGQHR